MDAQILGIYCLCDDLLKALRHRDDPQCQMSDAEVMTTVLVAAFFFGGSHEHARALLNSPRYVPHMLSKSRLNRRLHRLAPVFEVFFARLAEQWKQENTEAAYIIDTFPIAALDNIRIRSARLYQDNAFRGYIPSKRRFFYGLRLALLTTREGKPVEAFLAPGRMNDTEAVKHYAYDLPPGSIIEADRGCTDYTTEDLLAEALDITLRPMRKKGRDDQRSALPTPTQRRWAIRDRASEQSDREEMEVSDGGSPNSGWGEGIVSSVG